MQHILYSTCKKSMQTQWEHASCSAFLLHSLTLEISIFHLALHLFICEDVYLSLSSLSLFPSLFSAHLNTIQAELGEKHNHTAHYEVAGFQKGFRNMNAVRRSLHSDFNDTSLSDSCSDSAQLLFENTGRTETLFKYDTFCICWHFISHLFVKGRWG